MKKLSKLLLAISFGLSLATSAFATTVTANAEVVTEIAKEMASNNLLIVFIFPPFKRFFKKEITTRSIMRVNCYFWAF